MNLDLELEGLFLEAPSRVSLVPAVRTVEIVASPKDPSKGFIVVQVQGLLSEDRIALGRQLQSAINVFHSVNNAKLRRAKDINPDGSVDAIGQAFAAAQTDAEAGKWATKATANLLKAAREICAVGVVGWEAGQLRYKGADLIYSQEEQLIQQRPRFGLASLPLKWLEAGGFSVALALAVLAVSDSEEVNTKEQQWGQKEVPKEGHPLDAAGHVESPQILISIQGSPLR